jgi:phosphoglucosamine mutase
VVDGDFIMAVCAAHMKAEGRLARNTVVTTVMTNLGFDIAMKKLGINVLKTRVGDRYVLEKMIEAGANVGGEQSGHIIYLDHNTTGDGVITALQLLHVMHATGKPLSELARIMERLPQVLVNVEVRHKDKLEVADEVWEHIRDVEASLDGRGRILVRASGTEPMVRVMVESGDGDEARRIAEDVAGLVSKELE